MKIKVVHVGKTSSKEVDSMVNELIKRLSRFTKCEVISLPKIKGRFSDSEELRHKEGQSILSVIQPNDYLVLMDEKGVQLTSRDYSEWIRLHSVNDNRPMVFLIGGAYGFSDEVYTRANYKVSLSKMTFNHELALLVLVEQIYRAFSIIHGHPYHND